MAERVKISPNIYEIQVGGEFNISPEIIKTKAVIVFGHMSPNVWA